MIGYIVENKTSMQILCRQLAGITVAEYLLNLYVSTKNLDNANVTSHDLFEIVLENDLNEKTLNFYFEKIDKNLYNKGYWKKEAEDFVYSFFDYFVLGYGDLGKTPLNDSQMIAIMNYILSTLVQKMFQEKGFYKLVNRMNKKYLFF